VPSTDPQAGAQAPRIFIAQASTLVKVLAIAALVFELVISLIAPTWLMGLLVGVQSMAVREAFRKIQIRY
jgi:hypothetical protein